MSFGGLLLSPFTWAQSGFTIVQHGPSMVTPRMDHMINTNANGEVILFGGHTFNFAIEGTGNYYDTTLQQWQSFPMQSTHDMGGFSILPDGKWLVFGGCSSNSGVGQLATAEIFDPITKTSSLTGQMSIARTNCRGATLTDGKVLVVGNWYNSASTADIYDPGTGTFTATGNVVSPRSHAHVFPTDDGGAVVIGGVNEYGSVRYESIEYYAPSTDSFSLLHANLIPDSSGYLSSSSGTYPPSSLQLADGRYIFIAYKQVNGGNRYRVVSFDPATKQTAMIETNPPLPVYSNLPGDSVAFSGELVVDKKRNLIHLLGVTPKSTTPQLGLFTIDVDKEELIIPQQLVPTNYYIGYSLPILMHNGDIMLTGGSHNANFGAHDSVMVIRPTYKVPTGHPETPVVSLELFPNPAQTAISIALPTGAPSVEGFIVDVLGRQWAAYTGSSDGVWRLSVVDWPAGWYQVVLFDQHQKRYTKAFIKQ